MSQTVIFVVYGASAAIATYLLQKAGLTSVVSSCLVGLLGAVLGYFLKSPDTAAIIFVGSFVGMTSLSIGSVPMVLLGGAISGFVFKLSEPYFIGHGGRMGSIAFVSLLTSMAVLYLLQFLLKMIK